jgi:predicted Zn-dependent protease
MEQFLSNVGGKSDWVSRIGSRVLPTTVTVVDDPGAKDRRQVVIGGYRVVDEGVPADKITAVENGMLRVADVATAGPDSDKSNGQDGRRF